MKGNKMMRGRMDKAQGAMLGGAIGDALGITQEMFVERPNHFEHTHRRVLDQRQHLSRFGLQTELEGGGPWEHVRLEPGEWTDDTAMMLCLCDSIIQQKTVCAADLTVKFRRWWYDGYNACRENMSLGLGGNTQMALERFDPDQPDMLTGGMNPETDAGNGALMRLAPVAIYWHDDLSNALDMAKAQSQTTHNVQEAFDCCKIMTFIMWHGINGFNKSAVFEVLTDLESEIRHPQVAALLRPNASWRTAPSDKIITLPSRCLWTLEAALWCVYRTDSFEDAVVTAINLAGDCDTVGSITGQIAGSIYGAGTIPSRWTKAIKHIDKIRDRAVAAYNRHEFDDKLYLVYL